MWTLEIDYVTRNSSGSYLRVPIVVRHAIHVFYDCSDFCDLCQTST